MSKSSQVIEIEAQIKEEMSLTPKQIKFKSDVAEAEIWLSRELKRGLVPACLFNPLIASELACKKMKDINDLHSVKSVAKALVAIEYDNEKYINEGYL